MAQKFRARPDGTPYPITPKKSKGGWVALAAALGVALGSSAIGVSASVGVSASTTGKPASSKTSSSGRGEIRVDEQLTVRVTVRLRQRGMRVSFQDSSNESDCAAHAYGQVAEFLRAHPCIELHRAALEVGVTRTGVVLVAAAWVQMSDVGQAIALKALIDRPGSGNITELSRERGRYRSVRFTGHGYRSNRDGVVVGTVQVQPVLPGVPGELIADVARVVIN